MSSDKHTIDAPSVTSSMWPWSSIGRVSNGLFTLGRDVFEPGWRWSNDVKPIAGTDSCQTRQTGICLSGRWSSSSMIETSSPSARASLSQNPDNDVWTVGEEACVLLDTVSPRTPNPVEPRPSAPGHLPTPPSSTSGEVTPSVAPVSDLSAQDQSLLHLTGNCPRVRQSGREPWALIANTPRMFI